MDTMTASPSTSLVASLINPETSSEHEESVSSARTPNITLTYIVLTVRSHISETGRYSSKLHIAKLYGRSSINMTALQNLFTWLLYILFGPPTALIPSFNSPKKTIFGSRSFLNCHRCPAHLHHYIITSCQ